MKQKLLFAAIATLILCVGIAGATQTRVLSMGNVNGIVKDAANISMYPQLIANYPTWGAMEIGNPVLGIAPGVLYSIGGHYKLGGAVYGLYMDNQGLPEGGWYGPVVNDAAVGGTVGATAPKLNLFYGRKLGDNPFGLNINLFQNSWKDKTTGSSAEMSQMYLGLGLGMTMMEKLDLGLSFRTHSFTNKGGDGKDITKPDGGLLLDINARYWHDVDDKTSMVPYIGFELNNVGYDSTVGTGTDKKTNNGTMVKLGCGLNTWVSEGTLFVGDFGIAFQSGEMKYTPATGAAQSQKIANNQLPYYRFGMETNVNSWLVVRAGAERSWIDYSNDKVEEIGSSMTGLYLGTGMKKGDFMLDLNMDPGLINRGPYFLTGAGGSWSTMASLRYMPSK